MSLPVVLMMPILGLATTMEQWFPVRKQGKQGQAHGLVADGEGGQQ